ncbi:hypothetical protein, partial [Paracoccus sp. (in: a-proteobacteria)]|uniref:hypothetical protein n=1 Tax=Paracoccus sp. TaxID=267 RepID=UPI002AFDF292
MAADGGSSCSWQICVFQVVVFQCLLKVNPWVLEAIRQINIEQALRHAPGRSHANERYWQLPAVRPSQCL